MLSAQRNEPALVELEAAMRAIRNWEADATGVALAAELARARMVVGDVARRSHGPTARCPRRNGSS